SRSVWLFREKAASRGRRPPSPRTGSRTPSRPALRSPRRSRCPPPAATSGPRSGGSTGRNRSRARPRGQAEGCETPDGPSSRADSSQSPVPLAPQTVLERRARGPPEVADDPGRVGARAPHVAGRGRPVANVERSSGDALEPGDHLAEGRRLTAADVVDGSR